MCQGTDTSSLNPSALLHRLGLSPLSLSTLVLPWMVFSGQTSGSDA